MEDSNQKEDLEEQVTIHLGDPVVGEEERMQFHSVCDTEQEVQVPEVQKEDEDEVVEEDPDELLAWLEADPLIASRYTENDPEFAKECASEDPEIPIVTKWNGKSKATLERRTQEMDRKRQHGRMSEGDSPYYKRPRNDHYHNDYHRHGGGGHGSYSGPGHYNRGYGWRDDRRHDNCPDRNNYRRYDNRYNDRNDNRRHYDKYPRQDDRRHGHDRNQDRNDNRRHENR